MPRSPIRVGRRRRHRDTSHDAHTRLDKKATTTMTPDTHAAGPADQGERLQTRTGEPCLIRVTAAETNGACSVVEILSHPDDTADHVHRMRTSISSSWKLRHASCAAARVPIVLSGVPQSLKDIPKLSVIGSKRQDRVWCGGSFWRKTTRRSNASGRGSVMSMMSGFFALASHSEDIAALRGTASRPAEVTIAQGLDAPAEGSAASRISPPIAGCTDDLRRVPDR